MTKKEKPFYLREFDCVSPFPNYDACYEYDGNR
jgi:hypothetical protein